VRIDQFHAETGYLIVVDIRHNIHCATLGVQLALAIAAKATRQVARVATPCPCRCLLHLLYMVIVQHQAPLSHLEPRGLDNNGECSRG
jgi:hypothetical protein